MRMGGSSRLNRQRLPPVTHTHALFADQSHSIRDNLVALLSHSRAWNCSAEIAQSDIAERTSDDPTISTCALLYRCFVETEPTPVVAVPDWPQLPELTRRRWVQMATLLSSRLQTSEDTRKAQSQ